MPTFRRCRPPVGRWVTVAPATRMLPLAARERILESALELVGRDGLAGMSMDELAEVSSVSRAQKVVEIAGAEAREASATHVGTDHLLLRLLLEGEGLGAHVWADLGANLTSVREQFSTMTANGEGETTEDSASQPNLAKHNQPGAEKARSV
jgi:ATP-dependent Clp protease ATP-binding subunit ClpA